MKTREILTPIGHPNRNGIKIKPIAIVVHFTGNDSPSAWAVNNVGYCKREYKKIDGKFYEEDGKTPFRYGSAQKYIDENECIITIPTNECAYGCGDRNFNYYNGYKGQTKIAYEIFNNRQNYLTINYEICNNGDWGKACNNAIEEIVKDMKEYGIKKDMIYRHFDLSGKICAEPFVTNPKAWEGFTKKIIDKLEGKSDIEIKFKKELTIIKECNCIDNSGAIAKVFKIDDKVTAINELGGYWLTSIGKFPKVCAKDFVLSPTPQEIADTKNGIRFRKAVEVICEKLNCRKSPINGEVIRVFNLKDKLTIIDYDNIEKPKWGKLIFSENSYGWISLQYVKFL